MRLELHYLRTLVTVVLVTLGLNWMADATGIRWLNRRSDDLDTYSMLPLYQRFSEDPDVVFIGASHTWSGIIPRSLQRALRQELGRDVEVWNLGVPAGVFTQIPILTDLVFSGGRSPRVLLVELGPVYWREAEDWLEQNGAVIEAIEGPRIDSEAAWVEQAKAWLDQHFYGPQAIWKQAEALVSEEADIRVSMARNHGGQWSRALVARDQAEPGPFMPGLLRRELKAPRAARPKSTRVEPGSQGAEIVRGLLQRCAQEGCRVIFWNAPTTAAYLKVFPPGMEEEHLAWIRKQVRGSTAEVVNLNVPRNRRHHMFRDIDHLDPSGAVEITQQLVPVIAAALAP